MLSAFCTPSLPCVGPHILCWVAAPPPPAHGRPGDSSWTVTPRRHRPSIISRQTHPTLGCHSPLPHANSCSPGVWVQCWSLSHVWLFATPWTIAHQAPLSILEWAAVSYSRGSSQPRDQTWVSYIAGRFFTLWATSEAQSFWNKIFRIGREWEGEKLLVF